VRRKERPVITEPSAEHRSASTCPDVEILGRRMDHKAGAELEGLCMAGVQSSFDRE